MCSEHYYKMIPILKITMVYIMLFVLMIWNYEINLFNLKCIT